MESEQTLADDAPPFAVTTVRVGAYVVAGRIAVFSGVEVLTATHELNGARVILRRLLPLPGLPHEEAGRRLQHFQEEARLRGTLRDPRHPPLFDFARNPDHSAYQVFAIPDGYRGVPRDPKALPLEEWVRIASEAGGALESLLQAGIPAAGFDATGVMLGPSGEVRLFPLDFSWPPRIGAPAEATRTLAEWLYHLLAGDPTPAGTAPTSLCELNPRVGAELDMTVRAAINPYAVNAVSSPGELARLLRDKDTQHTSADGGTTTAEPTSNLCANIGAWAVLLAIGGVALGWLMALYFPRR